MPRKSQVRYWPSRKGGGFFTTHEGRQVELALGPDDSKTNGPVYAAAVKAWLNLTCQMAAADTLTVRGALLLYDGREWEANDGRHWRKHLRLLDTFLTDHGERPVSQLLPLHVTAWLKTRETWGPTVKQKAGKVLLAALNHCVREGHLTANPLSKRLTLPTARRRGKEARMSPSLMDLIERQARSPEVLLLLRALRLTGARPVELLEATVERYGDGAIIHPWDTDGYRWKNAQKTKTDRVIYLGDDLTAQVEAQVGKRTSGPLFRTATGAPWRYQNLSKRWAYLLSRPPVKAHLHAQNLRREHLTPYAYRHTFVSDWVESGRSLHDVATLCGTSVRMIERVYTHSDPRKVQQRFRDFLASR